VNGVAPSPSSHHGIRPEASGEKEKRGWGKKMGEARISVPGEEGDNTFPLGGEEGQGSDGSSSDKDRKGDQWL